VLIARPSNPAAMQQLVEALRKAGPTYAGVGASLDGRRPEGFRHGKYGVNLGRGAEAFRRAVGGLETWEAHGLPGVRVFPADREISRVRPSSPRSGLPTLSNVPRKLCLHPDAFWATHRQPSERTSIDV
jgi:hypothetical protein